ncbi:hypothetical protein DQP56_10305 [Mycolicibacter senuensis]|nr:hypothetical protein DQP56_10305 [Mycolicibacter senuensis]
MVCLLTPTATTTAHRSASGSSPPSSAAGPCPGSASCELRSAPPNARAGSATRRNIACTSASPTNHPAWCWRCRSGISGAETAMPAASRRVRCSTRCGGSSAGANPVRRKPAGASGPGRRNVDLYVNMSSCGKEMEAMGVADGLPPADRLSVDLARSENRLIRELIAVRQRRGLKPVDVARTMGVDRSTVTRFESGGTNPTIATINRYAEAVGAMIRYTVETAAVPPALLETPSSSRSRAT